MRNDLSFVRGDANFALIGADGSIVYRANAP